MAGRRSVTAAAVHCRLTTRPRATVAKPHSPSHSVNRLTASSRAVALAQEEQASDAAEVRSHDAHGGGLSLLSAQPVFHTLCYRSLLVQFCTMSIRAVAQMTVRQTTTFDGAAPTSGEAGYSGAGNSGIGRSRAAEITGRSRAGGLRTAHAVRGLRAARIEGEMAAHAQRGYTLEV